MSTTGNLLEAMAAVDAAGGRLRLVDGRVRVDVDVELPESVWQTLADHRDELIGSLTRGRPLWADTPIWPAKSADTDQLPLPAGADRCDRCRSTETVDQKIHDGQSVRRDCIACGRLRKFTVWYGVPMP